ncbi:hypothetical protein EVAR_85261_1 [Eumeta japonica]|uniref:Uncharacterized protein n=1 Tax=Eumeta variegata TaxID=151549 RepID=A0A4C1V6U6_EUMVA|nr:hypothetical protein EVAR_85261_1 [Eumeta japonica]
MRKIDWLVVLSSEDVNECFESFYKIVKDIVETNTPLTTRRPTQYPTWFSKPLLQSLKEKNKLYKRYKMYGNLRDYDAFSFLRKRFKMLIHECLSTSLKPLKKLLPVISKHSGSLSTTKKGHVSMMRIFSDRSSLDPDEISNLFSDYFASVFNTPTINLDNTPNNTCKNGFMLSSLRISECEIQRQIKAVDINEGAGLPSLLIKTIGNERINSLHIILHIMLMPGRAMPCPISLQHENVRVQPLKYHSVAKSKREVAAAAVAGKAYPCCNVQVVDTSREFLKGSFSPRLSVGLDW